jgi:lactate permease
MVGRQLPFFSLIVPFWLVIVLAGWRRTLEVWPACLVAGASFAAGQFLMSNYHGPWLVDIVSAIVSVLALVTLLRFWQPRTSWQFAEERPVVVSHPSRRESLVAWMPWVLLCIFVFAWGLPVVKKGLDQVGTRRIPVPLLNNSVVRVPPVVPAPKPEEAIFDFTALSATGTALLLAGIVGGVCLGVSPVSLVRIYGRTLRRVSTSLLTIAAMLALGMTSRYGGLDTTMGLAFAHTGVLFPFFSPLLGWLGVALTGSDTASNVLFGNLQSVAAGRIGVSPILTAAANSSGGVMGKMIDAQSITVATAATNQVGNEGLIFRFVFWHSVALAAIVGVIVLLYAYVFPQFIPHGLTFVR